MSREEKGVTPFWKGLGIGFICGLMFAMVAHGLGYYTAVGSLK